jgi:hypothetical protein
MRANFGFGGTSTRPPRCNPESPVPLVAANRGIYIRDRVPIFGYSENAMPDTMFDRCQGA